MRGRILCAIVLLLAMAAAQQTAAPAPTPAGHEAQSAQSLEKIWSDLMEGNRRFVAGQPKAQDVVHIRESEKMPTPNLQAMVDQIEPAVMKVKKAITGDALIEAAVKENVHQSAMNVLAHS
jgi:carbonic anhydrase